MHEIEWIRVEQETDIRQGDLLIKKSLRDGILEERLIVITADCDFAQFKTGGALAALRALPLVDYVQAYWTKRQIKKLDLELNELINSFNKIALESGHPRRLSRQAAESWVSRQSSESISGQLKITNEKLRIKFVLIANKIRSLSLICNKPSDKLCFDQMCIYYSLKDSKTISESRESLLQKVRLDISSLPEDTFLLNTLGENLQSPHVVMLRNLVFLTLDEATISAEAARENNLYLRHARLSPTFKYAISQQFGLLYSRIGLPKEYELAMKSTASNFKC